MIKCRSTVEAWTNSISSLSDSRFFDIMRLYLGEIETPYNKSRLIERLAGFIKNDVNSSNMIALLDEYDVKLLTALAFIPNATQETLIEFFAAEFSAAEVVSGISNLIARLFIFEESDKYKTKIYLRINPLLYDKLEAYIGLSNIVKPAQVAKTSLDDVFSMSPDFIAAFISFINTKGCSCKADGTLKKNIFSKVQTVFPGKEKAIQLLLNAFINLSLVREGEKDWFVDRERFTLFAGIVPARQYALLCAAACSRFSRDGLKKEAQLLLDTLCSVPQSGATLADVIKLGFLAGTTFSAESDSTSRFSRMLEAARQESEYILEHSGSIVERMLECAITFGLLVKAGTNSQGVEVYTCADIMKTSRIQISDAKIKPLNIDSAFTVSIMPGLSLKELLPLMDFLEIKNCAVVNEYEITRQSVSVAFDLGWNVEKLCSELSQYTAYEIPQNLRVSFSEWYDSYTSAMLYHGYVLKVAKNNITLVENNPKLKTYIKEKLAEGVYLLNIPVNADIASFTEESGLDFMGSVKNPVPNGEKLPFPALRDGHSIETEVGLEGGKAPDKIDFTAAKNILNSLKTELKSLNLNKNQRESLQNRIANRLILTPEHLAQTTVRSEILEADGMDFSGKLHLLEAGLKENDMMEITLPQFDNENEYFKVIGRSLGITKQTGDAVVRFEVYPGGEITNFVVSRITFLRRLRF